MRASKDWLLPDNKITSTIVNSCVPQTTPPDNSFFIITLALAMLEL